MTAHLASQIGLMTKALVRGLREQRVTVIVTLNRQPFPRRHFVLVDREYFYCNDAELASLEAGYPPEEIGLDPVETEEEEPSHG